MTAFTPQSYCMHEEWSEVEVFPGHRRIPHGHYLCLLLIQYHHHCMPMRRMGPHEEQCELVFLTQYLVYTTSCPGQLQQSSTRTKYQSQLRASFRHETPEHFITTTLSLDGEMQTPLVGAECCFSHETYIVALISSRESSKIMVTTRLLSHQ